MSESDYTNKEKVDRLSKNELSTQIEAHQYYDYFKRMNDMSVPIDYIAKYDKCGPNNTILGGEVYLLLSHKSFAVQELESTNFTSWVEDDGRNKKYSYAIYDEDGYIDKRKGSINYPVAIPQEYVTYNDTFVLEGDISHYILKHPIYNQVNIVSIKKAGFYFIGKLK